MIPHFRNFSPSPSLAETHGGLLGVLLLPSKGTWLPLTSPSLEVPGFTSWNLTSIVTKQSQPDPYLLTLALER